ncbi:HlyD family efflux transporter periplasmic adaptor subunit [Halomonas sp. MCCC 1A17488]|uniref:efflux RND transporter periplasmic adaptor subunit n=1 Tax=unclassified Halomonas TaxID=2609666 RepID=UPI0018D24EFF|nr:MULTISPECIES: HlyD family efflux transporter periplasmic adaptor subunit [unclassified Halomonas]MCE8015307.1 HlyD family efflux transporter periplasmic adaptor subunit [Halomonas sp. MCCC 1A17488]MCG3238640.1 HlyD family efflux transporter periplasmic adaptor subunit [Halomonas sp. MCCC 1A17488]QPP51385.1 HlyD family efflux transporter periplasmic adaptor subunit [Halomonas sp. SS10-MC5]
MKKGRRWIRYAIWAALGLGLLALLAWALRPMPVPVNVARVSVGPFTDSIIEEGRTRLRDTWNVSAPIAGFLQRVTIEEGDRVAEDDTLFRLEPNPAPALDVRTRQQAEDSLQAAQARLRAAQANLETARADRRFAEAEYQRYRQLHERNLISTAELEQRQNLRDRLRALENSAASGVEVARFEVESARALLAVASGQRSESDQPVLQVRAPVSGLVLTRYRCCEGSVSAGDPILELGSLDDLEIQVDLLSMNAVRLRPGMSVNITGWGGEPLTGHVRRIAPSGFTRTSALGVDEQRVPVIVDFADGLDLATLGLGSGFRVDAEFLVWAADEVLQMPTSALFRHQGEWSVFVIEAGRAVRRSVEPGRRQGLVSQVLSGLEAGDTVITHPGERVAEGVRVSADE